MLDDLIDYLQRTDVLLSDIQKGRFWQSELVQMRWDEQERRKVLQSKHVLEKAGYFVCKDENEIDAARLKIWVSSKQKK